MVPHVALINAVIFAFMGIIHSYWLVGGKRGLHLSLPTNLSGDYPPINPGPISSFLVASGLLGVSVFNASIGLGFSMGLPTDADQWGMWLLAAIFMLRVIGDFHYIGMFKKVTQTKFGRMDTKFYIPLCLYLGLSSAWMGWKNMGL